ncbi:hypothetical protein VO63_36160 [Streptomyces showdoensis]|uniref:Serine/threonine protein kinase n=2 Tax=Streptomyces showdoensis TaxID=68268 RepID=A0A2P2GCA8_STREW|nr:hypothetical protein [Streptomyces showdoensis]KKZ69077.1 hypothetical protein VO63_36160 [Streptomyces showdoensis]
MSPAKLRAIGLGTAVVIAVLVPIAATAGPAGTPSGPAATGTGSGGSGGSGDAKPKDLLAELGLGPGRPAAAGPAPAAAGAVALPSATRCGPELASPDGVEAQTCVVTEGADIRARTYYRNATGQELDAVLTLMAPGGRTVQVRCAVAAQDEPGACETPREPVRGGPEGYSAVSEFAGAGEGDSTPLLLRSGSNAAGPDGS